MYGKFKIPLRGLHSLEHYGTKSFALTSQQLGGLEGMKVDVRLPAQGILNSHGARPVYLIIAMIKWIRTSRLSIKKSLWGGRRPGGA